MMMMVMTTIKTIKMCRKIECEDFGLYEYDFLLRPSSCKNLKRGRICLFSTCTRLEQRTTKDAHVVEAARIHNE